MSQENIIYHLSDINAIACKIVKKLQKKTILLLQGDLGAGKTTLSKLIVKNLGGNDKDVTSPTFNLIHKYNAGEQYIWHIDLYRIKSVGALINLGIEDIIQEGIVIVEWGEMMKCHFVNRCLEVSLTFTDKINTRKIELKYV